MGITTDGGIGHVVQGVSNMPATTGAFSLSIRARINTDLNANSAIIGLVQYSGSPPAGSTTVVPTDSGHVVLTDTDGTSVFLAPNYKLNIGVDASTIVRNLTVGEVVTFFLDGVGNDIALSMVVYGGATVHSHTALTQMPIAPTHLFLGGMPTDSPSAITWEELIVYPARLSSVDKIAQANRTGPLNGDYTTYRPAVGADVLSALSAGSGIALSAYSTGLTIGTITAPSGILLSGAADIDLVSNI